MSCKLDFLAVQDRSKLSWLKITFSEQIVVLEEFQQSNSVTFYDILNLFQQLVELVSSIEIGEPGLIGGLGSSVRTVNNVDQDVTIFQKFSVLDFVFLITVDERNELSLSFSKVEAMSSQNLTENFG